MSSFCKELYKECDLCVLCEDIIYILKLNGKNSPSRQNLRADVHDAISKLAQNANQSFSLI
jgi:hypothetical protein